MLPLSFFVSLIPAFSISYILLMIVYFLSTFWKQMVRFLDKKSQAMSIFTSNVFALSTVLSTLSIHHWLSSFDNPSVVLICSSGLHITITMAVLNILYHLIVALLNKRNGFLLPSQLTVSYVVFCILAILLSAFYLHDFALSAVFLAILLGRVIWFDTDIPAVFHSIRQFFKGIFDFISHFSFKKLILAIYTLFKKYLSIIITCVIYIVAIVVSEIFDNLFSLFVAFDIGMLAAGVTIFFLEHKKHSKSTQEKEGCH